MCNFGSVDNSLTVCILHLALGRRARVRQVDYVSQVLAKSPYLIIMGDLNCGLDAPELELLLNRLDLWESTCCADTFPSWWPIRKIDHILVSRSLGVEKARVLDCPGSDHLPISLDVLLPEEIDVAA